MGKKEARIQEELGGGSAGIKWLDSNTYQNIGGSQGEKNGGAGGNGHIGGTGNPGGIGTNGNGTSGTGGLLILYAEEFNNKGSITSKGVNNTNGGASGGGSINIFYNQLTKKGTIEAIGGIGESVGGNGGDGSVTLKNINVKAPTITVDEIKSTSFRVNIEDPNVELEGITYDIYINGKKRIECTTLLSEIIDNLDYNTNYIVQVVLNYNESKTISNKINVEWLPITIYVSIDGDDENGDGTSEKPYASLSKAIEVAHSKDNIYIMPGEYNLIPMTSVEGYAQAGIYDQGKELLIYGENEKTILKYNGNYSILRDGPALTIENPNTIVRNLTYVFEPKLYIWSGDKNIGGTIFEWCNGTTENVFFRIVGSNKAIYLNYNGQTVANNVINCTFFHDLGTVGSNYSGICNFKNIATNVLTNGTNTNVITESFGIASNALLELIYLSKNNEKFNQNQVGIFYGENAWK